MSVILSSHSQFTFKILITFTVLLLCVSYSQCRVNLESDNKPVIGILSTPSDFHDKYSPEDYSYVKNSYAEFIEAGGAIPVVIQWNMNEKDLLLLLESINGVLFTGGDAHLWEYNEKIDDIEFTPFVKRAAFIFNYIIHLNDKGIHYPLYGICQGHEIISMSLHSTPHIIDHYKHPVTFDKVEITPTGRSSRMFGNMPDHLAEFIKNEKSMFYNHRYGFNTSIFKEHKHFDDFFVITAVGVDDNGKEFIAGLEAKNYPIYTVQYHPERVLSEWKNKTQFKHPEEAVNAILVKAEFFVNEAKKNNNKFKNDEAIHKFLLANHEHVYFDPVWPKTYFYEKTSLIAYYLGTDATDNVVSEEIDCPDCDLLINQEL